jgi:hypothetical protein
LDFVDGSFWGFVSRGSGSRGSVGRCWGRSLVGWSSWSLVNRSRRSWIGRGWRSWIGRGWRSWIGRSWGFVSGWFVFGILGFSLVFYVSDVTVTVGLVVDDLHATVGELNSVRSGDDIAIAFLRVAVVVVGRSIVDFPFKAVRLWGLSSNDSVKINLI